MNQDDGRPAMGADQRAHRDEEEARAPAVVCPFCRCRETELVSLFGGQLSTDQYYCRACHTYFERFSRDELADDAR